MPEINFNAAAIPESRTAIPAGDYMVWVKGSKLVDGDRDDQQQYLINFHINPPYGRTIGEWMKKANDEAKHGATVVCLVPARTDTNWWHSYCIQHEVRFIFNHFSKINEYIFIIIRQRFIYLIQ